MSPRLTVSPISFHLASPFLFSLLLMALEVLIGNVSRAAPGDVDFRFDPGGTSPVVTDVVPLADGTAFSDGQLFVNDARDFSFQNTNLNSRGLKLERFKTGLIAYDQDIRFFANIRQSEPTWIVPVTGSGIYKVEVSPETGRIYLAGEFSHLNGVARANLACLNADGTVDPSFQPSILVDAALIRDMSIEANGDLLLAGEGRLGSSGVVRFKRSGEFDSTFNPGTNFQGGDPLRIDSIKAQPDGKILISGSFTNFGGYSTSLGRVEKSGNRDPSFQPDFPAGGWRNSRMIKLLPDGRFYLTPNFRFMPNGKKDPSFNFLSIGGSPSRFEVAPDLSIYVSGVDRIGNETLSHDDVRILSNGLYDRDFDRTGPSATVNQVIALPDGKSIIWSGRTISKLNSDGSIDKSFLQPNSSEITTIAVGGANIYFAEYFISSSYGAARVGRSRLDGSADETFQSPIFTAPYNDPLQITALAPALDGGCLVSGTFKFANGKPATNFVRLNPNGALDASFSRPPWAGGGTFFTAAPLRNGQFYFGTPSTVRRVNADGTTDPSFRSQQGFSTKEALGSFVRSIVPLNDGSLLVGGYFSYFETVSETTPVGALVRLKSDGLLDTTFKPVGFSYVTSISVQSNGKIIVASDAGIERLNQDGSNDPSFRRTDLLPKDRVFFPPAYPPVSAESVSVDPWDDILIGGSFTSANGIALNHVARLLGRDDSTPLRFDQVSLTDDGIKLRFSGPTNYFSVLESRNGAGWFPVETNTLLFGHAEAVRRIGGSNELFRLRLSRP